MEQLRICALGPQLLPSRRRIRSFKDLLVQSARSASQCALRGHWIVHTCESGSMAASDEPLPSLPVPFGTSLDCPVGEVGLRTLAASLPLVPLDLDISIDANAHLLCRDSRGLTFAFVAELSSVASVLRTSDAKVWVCHLELWQ